MLNCNAFELGQKGRCSNIRYLFRTVKFNMSKFGFRHASNTVFHSEGVSANYVRIQFMALIPSNHVNEFTSGAAICSGIAVT